MASVTIMQGRELSPSNVEGICELIEMHPEWNRTRLSRELCALWDWHNAAGRPKDMAAHTLLLKLNRAGFVALPARQGPSSVNARRNLLRRSPLRRPHQLRAARTPTPRREYCQTRRIHSGCQKKYGHPVHALETFVERSRFLETCYRAANWQRLGESRGRTCNDRDNTIRVEINDVYLHPLTPRFREELCSA